MVILNFVKIDIYIKKYSFDLGYEADLGCGVVVVTGLGCEGGEGVEFGLQGGGGIICGLWSGGVFDLGCGGGGDDRFGLWSGGYEVVIYRWGVWERG